MKALLVIAHFFRPAEGKHSSTDERMRQVRREVLEVSLRSWRAHSTETATMDFQTKTSRIAPGALETLDIALLVHEDNHLFDDELKSRYDVQKASVKLKDPRRLPFGSHMLLASSVERYDWLVYAEEDLVLHDPFFFRKLAAFQQDFGPRRVLQPHRFELNTKGTRFKTYIDGDLRAGLVDPLFAHVEESQPLLETRFAGTDIAFERARNPHAGFFALSAEQLRHWKAQKHFMDADASFVSPLESAATLGIVKTFSVFKTRAPHQGYFEIEHRDRKFSNHRYPPATEGASP